MTLAYRNRDRHLYRGSVTARDIISPQFDGGIG
jgi:hypothetical protein